MAEKPSTKSDDSSNNKPQPIMSLVISNVGGPNAGKGTAHKRKIAIAGMLKTIQPNIVLFQEFPWAGIRRHSTWKNIEIPDKYEYFGHQEASILYDKNELIVKIPKTTNIFGLHGEMTRKGKLTAGFSPFGRMCILEIETKGVPMSHFLCISWHGSHNSKKESDLINELKNVLVFIEEIGKQMKLPFIIAGDFNISYEKACAEITQSTVIIYDYTPLKRREGKVIDFYISSKTLPLADIASVDWDTVKDAEGAAEIFDHDPVVATLMKRASEHSYDAQRKSTATNKLTKSDEKSRRTPSH